MVALEPGSGDSSSASVVCSAPAYSPRRSGSPDVGSRLHRELRLRRRRRRGRYAATGHDEHTTYCFEHKSDGERIDYCQRDGERRIPQRKRPVLCRWEWNREHGSANQRNDGERYDNGSQCPGVPSNRGNAFRKRTLPRECHQPGVAVGNVERDGYGDNIFSHHGHSPSDDRWRKYQPNHKLK